MEYTFTPKSEFFEGSIKLKLMPHRQRVKFLIDNGFNAETGQSPIDATDKLYNVIEKCLLSIDLKIKGQDGVIKDLETLEYYAEGVKVINQLGELLVQGIPLGNA